MRSWKKATSVLLGLSLSLTQSLPLYAQSVQAEESEAPAAAGEAEQAYSPEGDETTKEAEPAQQKGEAKGEAPGMGGPGPSQGQGGPGGPPGMGEMKGPSSESEVAGTGSAISKEALLSISGGEVTAKEGYESLLEQVHQEDGEVVITDLSLKEDGYEKTGILSEGSDLVLRGAQIEMNVSEEAEDVSSAGTALYTDSGTVKIEDSEITVNGAGRYTLSAEGDACLVVNDSVIKAGGDEGTGGNTSQVSEPASNAGLLISGTSRSNFSVGATHTYYYNSLCLAEGWAALSTDSATGNGLEFVGYNTEAVALHGGYGIYADTSCRDYLYGSRLVSAEAGAILSNNGSLTLEGSKAASKAVTEDGKEALSGLRSQELQEDQRSLVVAGRNDFQLHSPDMMGEGNSDYAAELAIRDTDLVTEETINQEGFTYTSSLTGEDYQVVAREDYEEKYGKAVKAYLDYISGAAILAKSTSANISLEDVTIDSYSGIALLTTLNSDSMSRYLKQDVGKGVCVEIKDSQIEGSFIHDDYQRDMLLTADGSVLTGAILYGDANQWNKYWEEYAEDENCCWGSLDPQVYVVNTHQTGLTLKNGSVWNVTEDSRLTSLLVSEDSVVNGQIEAETVEEQEDGSLLYSQAVVLPLETAKKEALKEMPSRVELEEEDLLIDTTKVKEEESSGDPSGESSGEPSGEPMAPPEGQMQMGGEGGPGQGGPGQGGPGQGGPGQGGPGQGGPGQGGPGQGRDSAANENVIGSWSSGGTDKDTIDGDDYDYDSALYVTEEGISEEDCAQERITAGTWNEESAEGIVIEDSESGHNGVLIYNTPYRITGSTISLLTDADGLDTCDFSGKGSAVAAFGSKAVVEVEDSTLHTSGVATMPVFADDGAVVTVRNSLLQSDGGTLYKEYMNTPDQGRMVAPPWILGIMGNARATNMMGDNTTTNILDSDTRAGAWAVLSTDAGSDMYLNVYNSSLTLLNKDESLLPLQEEGGEISESLDNPYTERYGSGYGSYVIGNAVETFAGCDMNVGTYAAIFTGGEGLYTSLEEGETYELKNAAGDTTCEYTAKEDKVTEIHSDTFGFMAHQGTNALKIEKGTVVDSGYATFLCKSGSSGETLTAEIDQAQISNGGVLVQVMDNDDTTNGGMMSTEDEANTNAGSQNFIPYHEEAQGFSTEAAQAGSTVQSFTFTNGSYEGSLYNASGSDGLEGTHLQVTLGEGCTLEGAAASTSAVHVTYEGSKALKEMGGYAFAGQEEAREFADQYQNTRFTINEYFSMGQVANLVWDNGANPVEMSLTEDALWKVTGTSLISSLSIEGEAQVVVPEGVSLTVAGTQYTDCILTAEDF